MGCKCAGSGVGVVIQSDTLDVTGSGTLSNPFKIESGQADEQFVLNVRDSTTVNLTLTGSGSAIDPYVIKADTGSAFALTELRDVSSAPPVDGQGPVWVGPSSTGHWEFQDLGLGSDEGGTPVAVDDIVGTIQDDNLPARLQQIAAFITPGTNADDQKTTGWFRGQNLVNAPATGWIYYEVMAHSASYVIQVAHSYTTTDLYKRVLNNGIWSKWVSYALDSAGDATDPDAGWTSFGTRADALTGGFGDSSDGWQVQSIAYSQIGRSISAYFFTKYTGADFTGGVDGNIVNQTVLQLPNSLRPKRSNGILGVGSTGGGKFGYVGAGTLGVRLDAVAPNIKITSGTVLEFAVMYHL